ncbi:MAG: hypothetical protein HOM55_08825 [Proteobacteria bacterium]|nr:hypothetical protein [Pseudomonadota bacterium]
MTECEFVDLMSTPRVEGVKKLFIFLIVMTATTVSAHHSEAAYDADSVAAFQGTVTEFSWRNPHAYIKVETTNADGTQTEWLVETGATPLLVRSGWTPESLVPGDRVSVRGSPARDGRPNALLLSMEKADGSVLAQSIAYAVATGSTSDLSGVWKGSRTTFESFAEQLLNRRLTEKAAEAQAQFDLYSENPAAACVAEPTPTIVALTGVFLTEIELGEDVIMMRNERFDVERTVYMDGRGHPQSTERTVQGHSVGSWEGGGTLVVDTTHFADHKNPTMDGVPSGAQKHVVERYTLNDDGTGLTVGIFMEDPEYMVEAFNVTFDWTYRPDLRLLRFDCDLEVARRYTRQ